MLSTVLVSSGCSLFISVIFCFVSLKFFFWGGGGGGGGSRGPLKVFFPSFSAGSVKQSGVLGYYSKDSNKD